MAFPSRLLKDIQGKFSPELPPLNPVPFLFLFARDPLDTYIPCSAMSRYIAGKWQFWMILFLLKDGKGDSGKLPLKLGDTKR